MAITGPWYITRAALEDYGRLTGRGALPPREELEAEIAKAHYVKGNNDGSEVWRGGKPLRLRFVVRMGAGVGGPAPQLVRVEGDHAGRAAPRARQVRIWDGTGHVDLEVVDEINEQGPERRVAYRLSDGRWYDGYRGRSRPDHVEEGEFLARRPDWVSRERGATVRLGKRERAAKRGAGGGGSGGGAGGGA